MHIAPSGGAAGTGVSEAKLTPQIGQLGQIAGAGGSSHLTSLATATLGDSAVIRELAVADLAKLAQILQPPVQPDRVARVDQLIQETVTAIRSDRREWAVGRFIEAVTTDPGRTDELRSLPDIEPIRNTVEQLLVRLTNVAKMDAETKLATAEQVIESAGWQKLPHWETAPTALIQIGHRLLEAGGYGNYIRTAELANTLQSAFWAASIQAPPDIPPAVGIKKEDTPMKRTGAGPAALALAQYSWEALRQKLPPRAQNLWRRAPLLVLLGAWFFIGLFGGVFSAVAKLVWPDSWIVAASDFGFEIWALGFLALVGFGFYATISKRRR
jgi:hypothetical protein